MRFREKATGREWAEWELPARWASERVLFDTGLSFRDWRAQWFEPVSEEPSTLAEAAAQSIREGTPPGNCRRSEVWVRKDRDVYCDDYIGSFEVLRIMRSYAPRECQASMPFDEWLHSNYTRRVAWLEE